MADIKRSYYDARSRYNKWVKRLQAEGYTIPSELQQLPDRPKKITAGSVRRVKALTEKLKAESVNPSGRSMEQERRHKSYLKSLERRKQAKAREDMKKASREKEKLRKEQLREKYKNAKKAYEDTNKQLDQDPYEKSKAAEDVGVVDYVEFVLDSFKRDLQQCMMACIDRGLSDNQRKKMNEAVNLINQYIDLWMKDPYKEGYQFSKALEEAKKSGNYITIKDIYDRDNAEQFIMRLSSYAFAVDFGNAISDFKDAASNSGYTDDYDPDSDDLYDKSADDIFNEGWLD